jgi:hypothetical protein
MDAEFNLFTDYHQFTVSDPTADFSDLWEKWTDATIESMFVQGDRYIAVGTARDFMHPFLSASTRNDPSRALWTG